MFAIFFSIPLDTVLKANISFQMLKSCYRRRAAIPYFWRDVFKQWCKVHFYSKQTILTYEILVKCPSALILLYICIKVLSRFDDIFKLLRAWGSATCQIFLIPRNLTWLVERLETFCIDIKEISLGNGQKSCLGKLLTLMGTLYTYWEIGHMILFLPMPSINVWFQCEPLRICM